MTSDNISPADPLGVEPAITDDTIKMLTEKRDELHVRMEQVRIAADQEIAMLKDRARQLDWLIRVGEQRRVPGQSGPEQIMCGCGRVAVWMTGFGYYHEVNGEQVPAGDACKADPRPILATPARLEDAPAA
ncbi:hypothetical protein [Nonomuraea lactucae]|uniref:hypothetical protein n=1 Tax=Nonomuraea lactucae TaxID=2249762 RepID=UPI000DE28D31|nr:hypothetical protein [Nonomuraea lactucae]